MPRTSKTDLEEAPQAYFCQDSQVGEKAKVLDGDRRVRSVLVCASSVRSSGFT